MRMKSTLECPVNFIPVDQNRIRLVALQVFLLSVLFFFVQHWIIPGILVLDFFFRAFNKGRYSYLAASSQWIASRLGLRTKPVDSAPKIFAAQMGFCISDCLFIVAALGLQVPAVCFASLLLIASFLEAFAGFCAGCYVYAFVRKFSQQKISD